MNEENLRNAMRENMPEPSEGFDAKIDWQLARLRAGEKLKTRIRVGLAVAVALVLALGMTTALAAFNDDVNQMLYRIWPRAAMALRPVNLVSESQGIRMEVVSASLSGPESMVTLTMQDLEGDRIDETMDLFDTAILQLPYDGSGTCVQTGYDPETRTASFAVYMKFDMDERPTDGDKVTFSVSRFLTHKKTRVVDLTPLVAGRITEAESMPVPPIRGWAGTSADKDHRQMTEQARSLRVLDTKNSLEIPVVEGVTLTGVGIIDGALHVQIRYTDIHHTDNHGFLTLSDQNGKTYDPVADLGIGSVSWFGDNFDSWEEYIFAEMPKDLSQVVLEGEFTTASPAIKGDWRVTFPLSQIKSE